MPISLSLSLSGYMLVCVSINMMEGCFHKQKRAVPTSLLSLSLSLFRYSYACHLFHHRHLKVKLHHIDCATPLWKIRVRSPCTSSFSLPHDGKVDK